MIVSWSKSFWSRCTDIRTVIIKSSRVGSRYVDVIAIKHLNPQQKHVSSCLRHQIVDDRNISGHFWASGETWFGVGEGSKGFIWMEWGMWKWPTGTNIPPYSYAYVHTQTLSWTPSAVHPLTRGHRDRGSPPVRTGLVSTDAVAVSWLGSF